MSALRSGDAGVRETAVKLAEPRLSKSRPLANAVRELADDPDPRVRFQCALALGFLPTDEALTALETIARQSGDDRWTHAAVISSAASREVRLLERFLDAPLRSPETGLFPFLRDLARAASRRLAPDPRQSLIERVVTTDWGQEAVWPMVVFNGLMRRGSSSEGTVREATFASHLRTLRERAARLAADERQPSSIRAAAIELLETAGADDHIETLVEIIASRTPRTLQLAAVRALARTDSHSALAAFPPARWLACAAPVREALCRTFLPRPEFAVAFIDEIKGGSATSASLSAATRKRLLEHADETVRTQARQILSAIDGDRMKVFAAMKESLELRGVASRGRGVFTEFCSTCHRLDRQGVNVGPDLFGIRNQTKEAILLHLIVPNREVTP